MYIEINLKQIKENLTIIKNKTKCKMMLMLKADAYGHDICEVAKYTEECVDFFGVAFYEEGKILKDANIKIPILILFADENEIEKAIINNFSICINNMNELKQVIKKSRECYKKAKIHLSFDTGINRLGFTENDINTVLEIIEINNNNLILEGVFSHFYSTKPSVMRSQFRKFKIIKQSFKLYENNCIFHMASSHAIQNTNLFNLDMIRIGILAYGINDNKKTDELNNIMPCMKIITNVIELREIKKGEGVGYSHKFIAKNDTKIAIAMGGYADGINVSFVNSSVIIKGKKFKIIAVCMDMFMIEVFNEKININDEIIILGKDDIIREKLTINHLEKIYENNIKSNKNVLKDKEKNEKINLENYKVFCIKDYENLLKNNLLTNIKNGNINALENNKTSNENNEKHIHKILKEKDCDICIKKDNCSKNHCEKLYNNNILLENNIEITALDIANEQNKIAYEILLGFHGRFKKTFIK